MSQFPSSDTPPADGTNLRLNAGRTAPDGVSVSEDLSGTGSPVSDFPPDGDVGRGANGELQLVPDFPEGETAFPEGRIDGPEVPAGTDPELEIEPRDATALDQVADDAPGPDAASW